MGVATVRAALAAFFGPTFVDGNDNPWFFHTYNDWPWILTADNWPVNLDPEVVYGTTSAIHIDSSSETRLTLPAYTGSKMITYQVSLLMWYQYNIPPELGPGIYADDWVVGLDLVLDAVKTKIRSNQTAGTNGSPIIQMGEGDGSGVGSPNITVEQDLPVMDDGGGMVFELTRVTWSVYEIITA